MISAMPTGELLKLDTDIGPMYVRPVSWKRLYLIWTFRHFRALSLQVLSRGQRKCIEHLCRTAVVSPDGPVDSAALIGVVEDVQLMSCPPLTLVSESQTGNATGLVAGDAVCGAHSEDCARVVAAVQPAAISPGQRVGPSRARTHARPALEQSREHKVGADTPKKQEEVGSRAGVVLLFGAVAIAGAMVFPNSLTFVRAQASAALSRMGPLRRPTQATAERHATPPSPSATVTPGEGRTRSATESLPTVSAAATAAAVSQAPAEKTNQRQMPGMPSPVASQTSAGTAASASVASPSLPRVESLKSAVPILRPADRHPKALVQLPLPNPSLLDVPRVGASPDKIVRPEYPSCGISGNVIVRAIVSASGRVEAVDVLSGNRTLAKAVVTAVRGWHYRPYQVNGQPARFQTQLTFRFLSGEVISIVFPTS